MRRTRRLELKSISNLYDQDKQKEALDAFSKKGKLTIPFFLKGNDPDMRFVSMLGEGEDEARTNEAELLPDAGVYHLRGLSGGGKTSTVFDYACIRRPLIYVCATVAN